MSSAAAATGEINDLSRATARHRRRWCDPVPSPVPCVLAPLFLAALAVALFIFIVVHNVLLLAFLVFLSLLVLCFLFWNVSNYRRNRALLLFVDRLPVSDLLEAGDGQIVKITGFASCGEHPLESSYEKVGGCVYTSTLLYERRRFQSKPTNCSGQCFQWNLAYLERFTTDFYITDVKSGTRALVKAGYNSKINPLIDENILVSTTNGNRELSSTLKTWLEERHLSAEARLLRLEEGYIKEGSPLTIVGMLSRKSGVVMIVPPPEPFSTGCLWQNLFLPIDVDGLILRLSDRNTYTTNSSIS